MTREEKDIALGAAIAAGIGALVWFLARGAIGPKSNIIPVSEPLSPDWIAAIEGGLAVF